MKKQLTHTAAMLKAQAASFQYQLDIIKTAQAALALNHAVRSPVFEAHIQADWVGCRSVMAEGRGAGEAARKARRLFEAKNGCKGKCVEVFIRVGNVRIAVHPHDLGKGFSLDDRVLKAPRTAFTLEENLPSGLYLSSPTPVAQKLERIPA